VEAAVVSGEISVAEALIEGGGAVFAPVHSSWRGSQDSVGPLINVFMRCVRAPDPQVALSAAKFWLSCADKQGFLFLKIKAVNRSVINHYCRFEARTLLPRPVS
jgi:hypothetical protein